MLTAEAGSAQTLVDGACQPKLGQSQQELGGERAPWELTGVSPDGGLLTLATSGGGCSEFQGWVSEERDAGSTSKPDGSTIMRQTAAVPS